MKENSEFLQELAYGHAGFFVCRDLGGQTLARYSRKKLIDREADFRI